MCKAVSFCAIAFILAFVMILAGLGCNDDHSISVGYSEVSDERLTTTFPRLHGHPLGQPVGPSFLPDSLYGNPYTGTFLDLTPATAFARLDEAIATSFDLFVTLAGPRSGYQNTDSTFCLSCFNAKLDEYAEMNLDDYILAGTLRGHVLFYDPDDPSLWGGQPVSLSDIHSAAAHARALFPSLALGIQAEPTFLDPGGPWLELNFAVADFDASTDGVFAAWRNVQRTVSEENGLGVVYRFDALTGNGGTPLTPTIVREWGKSVACYPSTRGIIFWEYDQQVFGNPQMIKAFDSIVRLLFQVSTGQMPPDLDCLQLSLQE